MKRLLGILFLLPLIGTAPSLAQPMKVSPNGARASVPGPAETFTGTVTVKPLFAPSEFSNAGGGLVEFTPRSPFGMAHAPCRSRRFVTEGLGWVQEEGGEKIEIKPGDVI